MGKTWFRERLYGDVSLGLKINKTLYRGRSPFQKIEILDTHRFGRMLALDGVIQTTEKDEFAYHEMMVHPPMFLHKGPRRVLVIGGGDGGILREVLKHPVEKAVLVEIDEKVIELCRRYLPGISRGSFSRRKAEILIGDGAKFVKETKETFDVIIIDSSDPIGPARVLFTKRFYSDVRNVLSPGGIMVRQCGSSLLQEGELGENYRISKKIFTSSEAYLASVPTYIGGFFTLLVAARGKNLKRLAQKDISPRFYRLKLKTKYYNPSLYGSLFAVPEYIRKKMR